MPYSIRKNHPDCPDSKPYAVVKTDDGKKMGCHETKKSAQDQIAAIESNESKNRRGTAGNFRRRYWSDTL